MSIISLDATGTAGTVETVSFAPIAPSDESLKALGVHLPLERNAQEYYDLHSAKFKDDLDFTASVNAACNSDDCILAQRRTRSDQGFHLLISLSGCG